MPAESLNTVKLKLEKERQPLILPSLSLGIKIIFPWTNGMGLSASSTQVMSGDMMAKSYPNFWIKKTRPVMAGKTQPTGVKKMNGFFKTMDFSPNFIGKSQRGLMPIHTLKANSKKSKVRAKGEHVFAVQKE